MTTPKIPKAGQSVVPLQTHRVKTKGKVYTYRGHKITFWFSEDEIDLLETVYNHIKATKRREFTDKERSTLSKYLKAVLLKYSKRFKERYID